MFGDEEWLDGPPFVVRELSSNKRLELLGDAYLRLTDYNILMERYPSLDVESISVSEPPYFPSPERAPLTPQQVGLTALLENVTLAYFAWQYECFDRDVSAQLGLDGKHAFDYQGMCADLFKAYVGAVYLDTGDDKRALNGWLTEVFS